MLTNGVSQQSGQEPAQPDLMSFFWRRVVSRSPSKNVAAPAYESGWNALNQLIRGDYSWNGNEPNVVYARRGGRGNVRRLEKAVRIRRAIARLLGVESWADLQLETRMAKSPDRALARSAAAGCHCRMRTRRGTAG